LGEPGGPQTRSLYLYDNLGVPWNRGYLMTTALGASAREALAQLIEADAANGDGPFVIVRFMNRLPLVAKGQFSADIGGGTLLELERAGVLWSDRRDADNRLKTFYLSSDSRQLLHPAIAAAGETPPLPGTPASEPGAAMIATPDEVEAKRADRHGAARGSGQPGWTSEPFQTRYQEAQGRPGPPPITTPQAVEQTRRELESRGQSTGERSIALEFGVSRDAVRYALGKDRGRRSHP
jgi:hypothetical protein